MKDKEFEKYLIKLTQSLPKKELGFDIQKKKEAVWLKVQSRIRDLRLVKTKGTDSGWLSFRLNKPAFVILSILIAAGLIGGATQASKSSLPGDALYPLKTTVERMEKTLADSEAEKIMVLKEHAQTRLKEVELLAREKKTDEQVFDKTLNALKTTSQELRNAATAASDTNPEVVDEVLELAEKEEQVLADVSKEIENVQAKDKIIELISATRESAAQLRAGKDKVKAAQDEQDEGTTATSTPTSTSGASAGSEGSADGADERVDAGIQIDKVINSDEVDGDEEEESDEPEIINQ